MKVSPGCVSAAMCAVSVEQLRGGVDALSALSRKRKSRLDGISLFPEQQLHAADVGLVAFPVARVN